MVKKSMQMVFCACGCGQLRPMYDRKGIRRYYARGHGGVRFKKGDMPWSTGKYLVHPNLTMSNDLAYILGVYFGDGYISYHKGAWYMGLHAKERVFVNSFREALIRIGLHPSRILESVETSRVNKIRNTYCRVTAWSNKFCEFAKMLDILSLYEQLIRNRVYVLSFLRGGFESEGSARNQKRHGVEICVFCNTDTNLINLVCELLKWLDWHYSMRREERKEEKWNPLYRIYLRGNSKTKLNRLYQLNPIIKKVI